MRVRMLETRRGTEDGYAVQLFEVGCEYDMADFLARSFIADGRAEALDRPVAPYITMEKE